MTISGAIMTPLDHIRTLVANCAAWQDWCGVSTAADAEDYIHLIALMEGQVSYPYCHLIWEGGLNLQREAGGAGYMWGRQGRVRLDFCEIIPEDLRGQDRLDEASAHLLNRVGDVIEDMADLSATDDYTNLIDISAPDAPRTPNKSHGSGDTDAAPYIRQVVNVRWSRF